MRRWRGALSATFCSCTSTHGVVRLRFLGTRGEIEARTRRHHRHSSLLVGYRRREVMIDCGLDWRDAAPRLRSAAIVLTHAHPDHAAGVGRIYSVCPANQVDSVRAEFGHPRRVRGRAPRPPTALEQAGGRDVRFRKGAFVRVYGMCGEGVEARVPNTRATAAVRVRTSSFANVFSRWRRTVSGER
jgi:glyoxylase-like metal-dependent hydrolase (beta-lactamase superfamily II)